MDREAAIHRGSRQGSSSPDDVSMPGLDSNSVGTVTNMLKSRLAYKGRSAGGTSSRLSGSYLQEGEQQLNGITQQQAHPSCQGKEHVGSNAGALSQAEVEAKQHDNYSMPHAASSNKRSGSITGLVGGIVHSNDLRVNQQEVGVSSSAHNVNAVFKKTENNMALANTTGSGMKENRPPQDQQDTKTKPKQQSVSSTAKTEERSGITATRPTVTSTNKSGSRSMARYQPIIE